MIPAPQLPRRICGAVTAGAALVLLLSGCEDEPRAPASSPSTSVTPRPDPSTETPRMPRATVTAPTIDPELPLAGLVVVLDPGHQLGNTAFPAEVGALVDAGGFSKPCNTTGTATDGGYPEATFTWEVARATQRLLRRLGARVLLTRSSNSVAAWGPVRRRARPGRQPRPAGSDRRPQGQHPRGRIARRGRPRVPRDRARRRASRGPPTSPRRRCGWPGWSGTSWSTEGFATSTYVGSDGIDVRSDLGTLNLADIPTVMVELGNMRDPGDAGLMTSAAGRGTTRPPSPCRSSASRRGEPGRGAALALGLLLGELPGVRSAQRHRVSAFAAVVTAVRAGPPVLGPAPGLSHPSAESSHPDLDSLPQRFPIPCPEGASVPREGGRRHHF